MLVTAASASYRAHAARVAVRRLATVVDAPGFKVAAVDRGEPTTSITVVAKAGSRYETAPGLAHIFKSFAFKTNSNKSSLRTVRLSELYGGVLSATLSREHVSFTAEFLRGEEKFFGEVLAEALSSTRYARHELEEEVLPVVATESAEAATTPALKAIDTAHSLAFRHGLGASLYAGEHAYASEESLREYARTAFSKGNVAVVGQGISADALTAVFAPHLKDVAAPAGHATKYFGGESRSEGSGPQTIFVGFGQAGAATPELEVLASYLSPTPSVKWSSGTGPIASAVPAGTTVETVLYNYSDAALFGFLIQSGSAVDAATAAKAAVAAFKAVSGKAPTAEEFKAAVAKSRFRAAQAVDGRTGFATATAVELLTGAKSSLDALSKVQASGLSQTATTLAKSKPVYVAIGDVHSLPYADEVGL